MTDFIAPLLPPYALNLPDDPVIWIGWGLWFFALIVLAFKLREANKRINRQMLTWMSALSVLVLVFTPFFGLLPKQAEFIIAPESPIRHLMLFAATPWMIAAGAVGVFPAFLLSGLSGFLLAYLDTHQIFTPLIFMTLAMSYGWLVRQRYWTTFYRWMRFPLLAAAASLLMTLPMVFISIVLSGAGSLSGRIMGSVSQFPLASLSLSGMVLIGGLVSVFVRAFALETWGSHGESKLAPGEKSFKFRVIGILLSILTVILVFLVIVGWSSNVDAARKATISNLKETTHLVADAFSGFVTTGEMLIRDFSDKIDFTNAASEDFEDRIAQVLLQNFFFDRIVILNQKGQPIGSRDGDLSLEEAIQRGLSQFDQGMPSAVVSIPPLSEGETLLYGFMAKTAEGSSSEGAIVLGLVDIAQHPAARSFTVAAAHLCELGGSVQVISRDGKVIFHTEPENLNLEYQGTFFSTPTYQEIDIDGQRLMQFVGPSQDVEWNVVSALPEQTLYDFAWERTAPLLLYGGAVIIVVFLALLISLSPLMRVVRETNEAAASVTKGNYDVQLSTKRFSGEIGHFQQTFVAMLRSLKDRKQKQSDLRSASEQLAYQGDFHESMTVLMRSALAQGVSSVRIFLAANEDGLTFKHSGYQFGMGTFSQHYAPLDNAVLARSRMSGTVILGDYQAERCFFFTEDMPIPASLIAIPILWENAFQGILWVTYENLRAPGDEEITFFSALAEKSAKVLVFHRLFDESQIVRQRLETFMNAMSDAILMTDDKGLVVYHNQAAHSSFAPDGMQMLGKKITSFITGLDDCFGKQKQETEPLAIHTDTGRVFQTIVNLLRIPDGTNHQAFLFRDITDQNADVLMKNEFVTTVSHELRSPLTLIHGYAKILRLTGNLNEQQDATMLKIIDGIEEMKHLVQNLLDIGRLEMGTTMDIETLDASLLPGKVMSSMEVQAKQKNIQVTVSTPDVPLIVEGDSTFLTQAIRNLVENAIRFTNLGGEVSISVRSDDNHVVFAIKDNGIGIAPLDQRHLFEKFYRTAAQVNSEHGSSGLGLAIVKSIAERHGGKVWFESQLGKGSTFYLQIPVKKPSF